LSCSSESNANSDQINQKTFTVQTVDLHLRSFHEYLEVTGTLKARNQIDLIVEEGGILKSVRIDKGKFAKKGDTLAVLENRVLRAQYDEAIATRNQAELDLKSKKVLFEKRAIPENDYLSSLYGYERAQAAYDLARARYDKLFIIAPISGFVNNRYYDFGAYAMPMTPIYDLVDNVRLKVRSGVAERFLTDINKGTMADIKFDAFPDLRITAPVSFVARSIDPKNRTFQIEIEIQNENGQLAPEMVANIKLLRRSYENKIVIPLDALVESEEGKFVFIDEENIAKKVIVNILAVYEDSVLVEGLEENQRLIVLGQRELTEGDALEVIL